MTLVNGDAIPQTPEIKHVASHKKNADLGTKPVYYSNEIFIEQEDARTFKQDEEVVSFCDLTDIDHINGLGECHYP